MAQPFRPDPSRARTANDNEPLALNRPQSRSEYDWQLLKETAFDLPKDIVYLNAPNLTPTPLRVRATEAHCCGVERCPSPAARQELITRLDDSREKAAAFLGGISADTITLTGNGTTANNMMVLGFPFEPDDEVIVCSGNHETNLNSWQFCAKRRRPFKVKLVSLPRNPGGSAEIVEIFQQAISPHTRLIAFSAVSNSTGMRLPTERICDMARQLGIYTFVDGAQLCGALRTDLKQMKCNIFTSSAHKYLLGPHGTGLLYVERELASDILSTFIGYDPYGECRPEEEGALKFEMTGQRRDSAFAALSAAFDLLSTIGPEVIEERILYLADLMRAGFREMGLALVEPEHPELHAGIVIIDVPPENRKEIAMTLYQKYGVVVSPTGGLRFGPHIYNLADDVMRALDAVRACRGLLRAPS